MPSDSSLWRIVQRYAKKKPQETAAEFASGFFKRYPHMRKFEPAKVLDSQGSRGHDPEAFQQGDNVYLCPKFWLLDAKIRDWVFAHELGHYTANQYGLAKLMDDFTKAEIDPWDTSNLPYAQFNMDEAFADCFAAYFLNRNELNTRYPKWEAVVHTIVG